MTPPSGPNRRRRDANAATGFDPARLSKPGYDEPTPSGRNRIAPTIRLRRIIAHRAARTAEICALVSRMETSEAEHPNRRRRRRGNLLGRDARCRLVMAPAPAGDDRDILLAVARESHRRRARPEKSTPPAVSTSPLAGMARARTVQSGLRVTRSIAWIRPSLPSDPGRGRYIQPRSSLPSLPSSPTDRTISMQVSISGT